MDGHAALLLTDLWIAEEGTKPHEFRRNLHGLRNCLRLSRSNSHLSLKGKTVYAEPEYSNVLRKVIRCCLPSPF